MLRRAFVAASVFAAAAIPLGAIAAGGGRPALFGLAAAVYGMGSLVCHQLPTRSFHVGGVVLPVCARCTGIYVGAAVTSIAVTITSGRDFAAPLTRSLGRSASTARLEANVPYQTRAIRAGLALAIMPTLATLVYEWTAGEFPSNAIRAAAGVPLGAVVAWIVCRVN